MEKDAVLIVTNADDPHVDYLFPIIQAKGVECFRFDTEDFPTRIDASIELAGGEVSGRIMIPGHNFLSIDRIASVWYRRPIDSRVDERITVKELAKFVMRESREFTESFWFQIDALWVNHPYRLKEAARKMQQLKVAKRIGWDIPPTLIANDSEEVGRFIGKHREVVVKTLYNQFIISGGEYRSFFAHPIGREDLKYLGDIKLCPCIFQKNINKALELRITVIGNNVFAAALDTQSLESAKTDWRRAVVGHIPCRAFELSSEIIQKSLDLVKEFRLNFSTMDVILTPEGEYVFLDLNPNGQWLWVESETGMPMAECFANLLAGG